MATPTFRKLLLQVMSCLSLETRLSNLKFVSLAVLELLAFNTQIFTGSCYPGHAHISETFVRGHVGTIPGNTPAKFEVRVFSRFGTLAFNAQKFMGSRDPGHAHFSETFVRVMSGLSMETRLPNLKFVSFAVLELLTFNAQKCLGSRDSSHAPFYYIFTFRDWRLPRHVV